LTIVISEEVNRMDWEKASVELGIELSHLLTGFICQKKPMFGSPVYFINDNMFTGFFMKEYVEIPESRLFDQDFILKWLQASYQFVSSLPRKEKKAKR
jgi:hypothetical protein